MATYEYRIVHLRVEDPTRRMSHIGFNPAEMNRLAAKGWRVVAAGGAGGASQGHRVFDDEWVVMEREVEQV